MIYLIFYEVEGFLDVAQCDSVEFLRGRIGHLGNAVRLFCDCLLKDITYITSVTEVLCLVLIYVIEFLAQQFVGIFVKCIRISLRGSCKSHRVLPV